jgi:chemotaxis signal transduction protein
MSEAVASSPVDPGTQRLVGTCIADRVLNIVSLDHSQLQCVPRVAETSGFDFRSGRTSTDGAVIALIDLLNLLSVNSGEVA